MPRRAKSDATQPASPKGLPPIQHALSSRQQREVLRYASNFGVDATAVLREIQAALSPAVEKAVMRLVRASEGYESAKADYEHSLRARFRGADGTLQSDPRPSGTLAPAEEGTGESPAVGHAYTRA